MLESLNTNVFEYEKLKPEEMQRRGILGRLVGVMADTVNPTRNGRSYSSKLWDNVFNNPIMKERIENNCCFGELGHPLDREETDMTKIAICMDGMPKKDKNGKLQAVFNILDTPNGRILKSLCDYGCNIGISSRGSGDLITDFDGNESVDPDTYNCEGWDAVIIPAVKEARLTYVTEALDKKRYNKSLRDKLQEAIDKETEDNKKVMRESLNTLGIRLTEENEDSNMEDDTDSIIETDNNENDFFYKGIEVIKDPNSGKFVCEIDGDSYSFNSEKNAKIWIDMKVKSNINKTTRIKDLAYNTQNDIRDQLSKVLSSDEDIEKGMNGKLSDLEDTIDISRYLKEEQVGRDSVKDDKNVDDVLEPEIEDSSEEDEAKDEDDDKTKVTITVNESIDWTELNGTEQSSVEAVIHKLENGEYRYLDDLELDCDSAVNMYNEANAFDEYANEDFFEEEGDPAKVYEYILNAPHYKKYVDKLVPYTSSKNITEDVDDVVAARMQLCQILDDWYDNNIANETAVNVRLAGWDRDLQDKYLDFRNYLSPDLLNFDEVDDIESEMDSLQEMLKQNNALEKQIVNLNEKLSVSYTMEKNLNNKLREYEEKISLLSKTSKQNKVLTEQLTTVKDSEKKLLESKKANILKIKTLEEELNKLGDEKRVQETEFHSLKEDYDVLNRDLVQTKKQFSERLDRQNKLLERYQKITKNAVERYINMQATNLGIKPVEIKNRLSEDFTFNEIDSVCENLREYKLNVSRLPFNTGGRLNEGIGIRANNIGNDSIIPKNDLDELTDYDLKLMEAYL